MGNIGVYNVVTDYSADPTGLRDSRPQIQRALNDAGTAGGGIVYFPKGVYGITDTLLLPSRVQMLGVGGTTFGTGENLYLNHNAFIQQSCVSVIRCSTAVTMLQPLGDYLDNSSIENLVFYSGNGSGERLGDTANGIILPNLTDGMAYRGQSKFRNLLIYNCGGTGFYGGTNHHELHFDNVICYGCRKGFELKGQDIKAFKLGAGLNTLAGIEISKGGAGRYYDIDTWQNDIGVEIYDAMNISFFGLVSNMNVKYGLYIHKGSEATSYNPSQVQIFRGNFQANSTDPINAYPDVLLSSNPYGPFGIEFIGCLFRGSSSSPKPNYAIMDSSSSTSRNIVSNCFFQRGNYASGLINRNDIYSFKNNYDAETAQCLDEANLPYAFRSSDYALLPTDCYLTVDCNSGPKVITLPLLNLTQVGKVFIISKNNAGNTLTISPSVTNSIVGITTLPADQFSALLVVNGGSSWYSIRIS
jgi:hypothetical protein